MMNKHMAALLPTSAFVLLWSSAAIVSEIGLRHGSSLSLLIVRFAVALAVLIPFALWNNRTLLPAKGTRLRAVATGFIITGVYTVSYLLALANGVTPGALATILGVQPVLTILLTERGASPLRMAGLLCALAGLALVVSDGLLAMRFGTSGLLFAGLALLGITFGAILQKQETQAPWVVLPLQYIVGFTCMLAMTPFMPLHFSLDWGFVLPAVWLGLVISIAATFLLYTLIARGNLVNVTSLFYLPPGITALLDWIILGNPMSAIALAGLGLIVIGLLLVLRPQTT